MTLLLICGSRDASPYMLAVARKAVERAHANGWKVIVGDAGGVDHAVLKACCQMKVPFAFYGITNEPRHWCCDMHKAENYHRVPWTYLDRDKYMVEASDRCFAVWNKSSRGTQFTFSYARALKKQVDVWEQN